MARILLIEDDPHGATIATRVLERAGHEVHIVYNGIAGIKLISDSVFDLVLLDMGLPDLGGHTVAALIKRIPDNPVVVALTASTDSETERRAYQNGCAGFLTKPIDTRTFASQVEVYLNCDGKHA